MTETGHIRINWQPRARPLVPVAAAATAAAALALARRLLAMEDAALAQLRGAAGQQLIIVIGEAEALPWVDGIVYLGRDPAAPSLLVPTALVPDVPMALIERAFSRRLPNAAPVALLTNPQLVVPVAVAKPIARDALKAWMEADG